MRLGIERAFIPNNFRFAALRWPLVVIAVVTLVGGLGWGLWAWIQKLTQLIDLGWAAYVGQPQANPVVFVSACARDPICKPVLEQAWQGVKTEIPWPLLGGVFFASAIGAAVAATLGQKPGLQKAPGGARWATKGDLKPLLRGERDNPQRGYLGVHSSGQPLRPPERLRCAHTLLVGGTGAGKSTGYYKPNLLMDALQRCSAAVIDLKYPDTRSGLFDLVPVFAKAGHDVQLFLPFDTTTLRLPLLQGAEDSITAAQITDILTPLRDTGGDGGFFSKQQRALLAGLILGFARRGETSLAGVARLLLAGTHEVAAYVRSHPDAEVRERLGGFFEQETRIRHGVVRGLVEELELFLDPRLEHATTASANPQENIDLATIGARPTLLYIGIPQDELMRSRGQTLLQLVKRILDSALIRTANAHGGQLPVHTSIYLDEFASLGPLPNVGEGFATMRSRRVAYHVSLQNRAQGEAVYGREAFRSFVSGNLRQTLIFPRYLSFEDATYFSEAMGELTAVSTTTGTTRKHAFDWPNHHRRQQEVGRPLLSIEEMRDWPEGMGVLLQGGSPPSKVLLPRLDERRLLEVRNPLHQIYRRLAPRKIEVSRVARDVLEQRKSVSDASTAQYRLQNLRQQYAASSAAPTPVDEAVDDLSHPTSNFGHGPEKKIPPQSSNATPNQTSSVPSETAHHALREWFVAVLEHDVPVQVEMVSHRHHEVARLVVPRASLPTALRAPDGLKAWTARGWVMQAGDTLAIVGEGHKLIGEGQVKRSRILFEQRQKAQGEQAARVRVRNVLSPYRKDKTAEQLRTWITANGRQLEGHPEYEALGEDDKVATDLLGWYQPRTVRLPNETFRQLVGELPENLQTVRIDNRQGSEISVGDLEHYPKLLAWCRDHTHLLKGHPAFEVREDKDELEPVGLYQEEAVALPKREYQRILGKLPDGTSRRDLTIGHGPQRRKRRLQTYTFAEEAF